MHIYILATHAKFSAFLYVCDHVEVCVRADIASESRRRRCRSRQHGSVQSSEDFPCSATTTSRVTLGRHEGKSHQLALQQSEMYF